MEYDPSGKVQRVSQGQVLPPGTCILCGTGSSDDGFLDVAHIDWFGAIYLCIPRCALEIGAAVGAYSLAEYGDLQFEANASLLENSDLRTQLEEAHADLDSLRRAITIVNGVDSDSSSANKTSDKDNAERGEQHADTSGTAKSGAGDKAKTPEPVNEQGPNDSSGSESSNVSAIGL